MIETLEIPPDDQVFFVIDPPGNFGNFTRDFWAGDGRVAQFGIELDVRGSGAFDISQVRRLDDGRPGGSEVHSLRQDRERREKFLQVEVVGFRFDIQEGLAEVDKGAGGLDVRLPRLKDQLAAGKPVGRNLDRPAYFFDSPDVGDVLDDRVGKMQFAGIGILGVLPVGVVLVRQVSGRVAFQGGLRRELQVSISKIQV